MRFACIFAICLCVAFLLTSTTSVVSATRERQAGHWSEKVAGKDMHVNVNYFRFPGLVREYWWMGTNLVALCGKDVYISSNYGKKWMAITGISKDLSQRVEEVKIPSNGQRQFLVSTNESTYVISDWATSHIEFSRVNVDEGSLATDDDFYLYHVAYHPVDTQMAIALGFNMRECIDNHECTPRLFTAVVGDSDGDNFAQWKHVPLPTDLPGFENRRCIVTFVEWESPAAVVKKTYDPDKFFVILHPEGKSPYEDGLLARFDYTTRKMEHQEHPESIFAMKMSGKYMFVAAFDKNKERPYLLVSEDNYDSHAYAKFPKDVVSETDENAVETGYTIVDAEMSAFVNVYRGTRDHQQQWGHTYESGAGGTRFTLSLPYNRRLSTPYGPAVDFHRLDGMAGTIIANVVSDPDNFECRQCRSFAECGRRCTFHSVMSRDNGKTWQPIEYKMMRAVEDSGDGNDDDDEGCAVSSDGVPSHCRINLHGYASTYYSAGTTEGRASSGGTSSGGGGGNSARTDPKKASVMGLFSSRHAPGLIMALGNVGRHLNTNPQQEGGDIFMSRDGGERWRRITSSPHIFGETDYGGLIYLLPLDKVSNHLNFSIDEGKTWLGVDFAHGAHTVDVVLRPPKKPNAHFISLFSVDQSNDHSIAYYVSFDRTKFGNCEGLDDVGGRKSDYEYFTPRSYFSEEGDRHCLLGKRVDYVRKKYGVSCWQHTPHRGKNNPFELPNVVHKCHCTYDDFECEWFTSETPSGKCVASAKAQKYQITVDKINEKRKFRQCIFGDVYDHTKGYRKIVGDECEGGVDVGIKQYSCDGVRSSPTSASSPHGILFFAFIVLLIGGGGFGLVYLYRKNDGFRDAVQSTTRKVRRALSDSSSSPIARSSRPYAQLSGHDDDDDDDEDAQHAIPVPASHAQDGDDAEEEDYNEDHHDEDEPFDLRQDRNVPQASSPTQSREHFSVPPLPLPTSTNAVVADATQEEGEEDDPKE